MADGYLVETSVWTRYFRRNVPPRLKAKLDYLIRAGAVKTCDMVRLELLSGIRNHDEYAQTEAGLDALHVLPTGPAQWAAAGRLGHELRRIGENASPADLLIASVAITHGVTLLHADSDFERIARHSSLLTEPVFDLVSPQSPSNV